MELTKLNVMIVILIILCVWLIISDRYIEFKQEELSLEYKKYFGEDVKVYIPYFTWECHFFKKYILRKESFIHEIEKEILEKKLSEKKKWLI